MSTPVARRANFHLNAARTLYALLESGSDLDRHQHDSLLMAVIMHLELALAFYVFELKAPSRQEVDVSSLLEGATGVSAVLANVPTQSAKELISLTTQSDAALASVFAWGRTIRRCGATDDALQNTLFSVEEDTLDVIASSSNRSPERQALPHDQEVGVTIDSLASLMVRQRGDAEEY